MVCFWGGEGEGEGGVADLWDIGRVTTALRIIGLGMMSGLWRRKEGEFSDWDSGPSRGSTG